MPSLVTWMMNKRNRRKRKRRPSRRDLLAKKRIISITKSQRRLINLMTMVINL